MSIEELKSLQLKIIKKNKICNLIGIIIIGIIMSISIFVALSSGGELFFCFVFLFIELIFSIIILTLTKNIVNGKDIKIFNNEFKNIFVLTSLRKFFGNLAYNYENGFSEEYIQNMGMLDTGDRFNSNDYISGTYKNIKFEQSDICIEEKHEERDSDGNKKEVWDTIFEGRVMVFDFNKKFKSTMQVSTSYFSATSLPSNKQFYNVKMEDIEFNKLFTIYAENEHDAFYILTPHFMQKIKDITRELNCGVMFGFIDSRLYIAINNNEDSFEYNVFKPINEQEIENNIVKEIKLITSFVDELDLDNDLFKTEV